MIQQMNTILYFLKHLFEVGLCEPLSWAWRPGSEAVHLIITETTLELDFLLGNSVHEMSIIILV